MPDLAHLFPCRPRMLNFLFGVCDVRRSSSDFASLIVPVLFQVSTTFLGVFLLTADQGESDDQDNEEDEEPGRSDPDRTRYHALPESAPLLPTISRSSINNTPSLALSSHPIRLRHRSSTTSLAGPRSVLASGGGFLLMATTPPAHPHGTIPGLSRSLGARSRSASRSGSRRQDIESGSQPG